MGKEKLKTRESLLAKLRDTILWSLLLEESEKQELLKKIDTYDENTLKKLMEAFDKAKKGEDKGWELLGQITPDAPEKIKEIRQKNIKNMLKSAEKEESSEEKAEEILKEI